MVLHADNCCGQNKNSTFLQYLIWCIAYGLLIKINYDFMLAGHTKFLPDACFEMLKKKTRKTFISSLTDIVGALEDSSFANVAELVGNENGYTFINTYDLKTYLSLYFRNFPRIKSYQHFRLRKIKPWCRLLSWKTYRYRN